MEFLELIFKSFYFIAPVYLSNMVMVAIYFAGLKDAKSWISTPVDFGIKMKNGNSLIGPHKKWIGLFISVVVAVLVVLLQKEIQPYLAIDSVVDYQVINVYFFGALLGAGSFFGDLFKSFLKRRINFKKYSSFPILDQIDHPSGAILFSYFLVHPSVDIILTIILITIPLAIGVNFISYKLGIKNVWW